MLTALPLRNEHQVGEEVDINNFIQHDRFVLGYVVPGSFINDFSKPFIKFHENYILLLILEGDIVLLVDLVIALNLLGFWIAFYQIFKHVLSVV